MAKIFILSIYRQFKVVDMIFSELPYRTVAASSAFPLMSHFFPFPPIQMGSNGRKEDLGRTMEGR